MKHHLTLLLLAGLGIGNGHSQAPTWLWANSGNTGAENVATECCVDQLGNAYVAGYFFYGQLVVGADTLISSGVSDVFLAKYDPDGVALWARRIGGSAVESCHGLHCDESGNVYLTGAFTGGAVLVDTVQLTSASPGFHDCYIAKFDSEGTVRMAKAFGGNEAELGNSIVLGTGGHLYLSGRYYSTDLSMDGNALPSPQLADWFIAKLDTIGTVAWVRTFGGASVEHGSHLAPAPDGGIYWTGSSSSDSIDFDGHLVSNSAEGTIDGFVLRMDGAGNVLWADHFGGIEDDYAVNIAVDSSGFIYLGGDFKSDDFQMGQFTLGYPGLYAIFWSKWDPDGNVLFARGAGASQSFQLGDLDVSPGGDLLLGGTYRSGQFAVDGLSISNSYYQFGQTSNLFLMRTNNQGDAAWLKSANQGQQDEAILGVALYADSSGYAVGEYEGTWMSFDGHAVNNADPNEKEFFVARFDPDSGVGMTEARSAGSFQLHPNPAAGFFMVQAEQDIRSIEILDPLGSNVVFPLRRLSARSALIEVPGLSIGLYLVVVHTPAGRSVQRLVIE